MLLPAIRICFALLFSVIIVLGSSAAGEKDGVTYEKDIKPILSQRCLPCHGSNSPTMDEFDKDEEGFKKKMKGPRMDTYANLIVFVNGKDAGALMRRLDDGKNTKEGKPGNMYQYLGTTDAERAANLARMKKWVGGWTLKRRSEMTGEDLRAIKALEK